MLRSLRLTTARLLLASSVVVGPVAVMTISPAAAQEAPYGADPGNNQNYGEDPYGYGNGGGGNDPDPFQNNPDVIVGSAEASTTTTTQAPAVTVAGETLAQDQPAPALTNAGAGPVAETSPVVAGSEEAKELPRTGSHLLLQETVLAVGLMAIGLAARAAGRRRRHQA